MLGEYESGGDDVNIDFNCKMKPNHKLRAIRINGSDCL